MSRLRVAVTRDETQGGPLTQALAALGMEPVQCAAIVEAPAADPAPLARAAAALESYDWLVVASARAVAALIDARSGAALPARLRTAAVGAKTAARLVEQGAAPPLTGAGEGAEALLEALRGADDWRGRRVLIPRAAEGGREIALALERLGAVVEEVEAYRTIERPREEIAAAWTAAAPEAAVVASPSAARALVRALGAPALCRLAIMVAIGSKTAMALAALGVPAVVPARADFESAAERVLGAPAAAPVPLRGALAAGRIVS